VVLTSTALQASSVGTCFRSDTSTSGWSDNSARTPYGLYNFSVYASRWLFVCASCLTNNPNLKLRAARKTRYGWLAKPYPTGTFTLQVARSFACRTNAMDTCDNAVAKRTRGRQVMHLVM